MKQLTVSAIKDGTVIDHLPPEVTFKVIKVLNLQKSDKTVTLAHNLKSKKMKKKGIVKVAGKALTQEEANKVALLAPTATVNIIKNYNVSKKLKLALPKQMNNIIKCSNPQCITNHETVPTKFNLVSEKPLKLQCGYCERKMGRPDITLL